MTPRTGEVCRSVQGGCMYSELLPDCCLRLDIGCQKGKGRKVKALMPLLKPLFDAVAKKKFGLVLTNAGGDSTLRVHPRCAPKYKGRRGPAKLV